MNNHALIQIKGIVRRLSEQFKKPDLWDQYTVASAQRDLKFALKLLEAMLTHEGVKAKIVVMPYDKNPAHHWHYYKNWYTVGQVITVVPIKMYTQTMWFDVSPERLNRTWALASFGKEHLRRVK